MSEHGGGICFCSSDGKPIAFAQDPLCFFTRIQETPQFLVRFLPYPAGFRNSIPKHGFTGYC
jgi:hypothetical protein